NAHRELDVAGFRSLRLDARSGGASHAALLACLGSEHAHAQVVRALASAREDDVQIAQVYLRHRSIADTSELRSLASDVARMKNAGAQVLALDTLARQRLSDPAILESLAGLFPRATTLGVQRAIAGVLIRAGHPVPGRAGVP